LEGILLFVHIVVCVLLVVVVLLQSGKSADLAGAFGGYGSQSTFGPRGAASFLSKMTTTLAILFMVTSLLLWIAASKKSTRTTGSVLGDAEAGKPAATRKAPVKANPAKPVEQKKNPAPAPTPAAPAQDSTTKSNK
jgi:preprotein translocase subunit SecG